MGSVTYIVGHRGVGKTTFLRLLGQRHPEYRTIDLDDEIARREGASVAEVFARGEAKFRAREIAVLEDLALAATAPTWIAVGAGFTGPLPPGHVLWLRRVTDAAGRVFLNRPSLDPQLSPFAEFMRRLPERQARYRAWADEELWLPEGGEAALVDILDRPSVPFDLTLLPENFKDWPTFWARRRTWNLRRVEVRDDLLLPAQIAQVRRDVPAGQILWSSRRGKTLTVAGDWPLEQGAPPAQARVISLHEPATDGETLGQAIARLDHHPAPVHKLAFEIRTFAELLEGHTWWTQDPARRAFLPRSPQGRWRWYRQLFGVQMPLHFIREGEGSGADQPFWWQHLLQPRFTGKFGAVLGHPVEHSLSPMEHAGAGIPFVAIDLREDEFARALPVLLKLGLQQAAVTAPLKLAAGKLFDGPALNTLYHDGQRWHGQNTDAWALTQLAHAMPADATVWVWGQGGMRDSLTAAWPRARFFSAREGRDENGAPDILIWACGRSRPFRWPGPGVRPHQVLDLNYGDDSPGLEFAKVRGLPYQSGHKLFKLQASRQRQFWKAFQV